MNELKNIIRYDDLVFDVGANTGNMTQVYSDLGARVVAFEANPDLIANLTHRFAFNQNILIENKALCDRKGFATLNVCTESNVLSTCNPEWFKGRFRNYTWNKKISIPSITLDIAILFFGPPRYIKIDVEGFEPQVISGLSTPVDFLSFEFTSEFFINAGICINHLKNIGMSKFNLKIAENKSLLLPKWLSFDAFFEFFSDIKSEKNLWGDIFAKI